MTRVAIPRKQSWKRWWRHLDKSLGSVVILMLLWFGAMLFSGRVVLPLPEQSGSSGADSLSAIEPTWRGTALADQMRTQFALDTYSASRWSAGQLPLWQPRSGIGVPHFAAPEAGPLAPTRLLAILIAGDPLFTWMVSVALAAILSGLFLYAFLRQIQVRPSVAALAGFGLAIHPAWLLTGWLGSLTALLWLPFLLWQSERHLRVDHAFGPVVCLAFGVAATLYSGDMLAAGATILVWLTYLSVRLGYRWWRLERTPESRPRPLHYLLILSIGVLLAAPGLWPALLESWRSGSFGATLSSLSGELTSAGGRLGEYDWWQILLAWIPLRYALEWFDISSTALPEWLARIGVFVGFTQTALWALAWSLVRERRQLWFWTASGLLSLILAFLLPSLTPVWVAVGALAGLVIGMLGLEAIMERQLLPSRRLVLAVGALLVAELSWVGWGAWPFSARQELEAELEASYALEQATGHTYALNLETNRMTLATADGQSLDSPFEKARPPIASDAVAWNWQGIGFVRSPDVQSFVAAGGELNPSVETNSSGLAVRHEKALPLLYLSTHAVVFGTAEAAREARDSGQVDLSSTVILEALAGEDEIYEPLLQAEVAPVVSARVVSVAPERIVTQVAPSQPAVLVRLAEFDPGWHVLVDGNPGRLVRANGIFQAVLLAPGEHEVIFEYRPLSLYFSVFFLLSGLGILGVWWLRVLRARRHADLALQDRFHVV